MGRARLLSSDHSLSFVILWSALAVAMLFLLHGCSAISSGSSHKSAHKSVNWQEDGTYLVNEENLDSVIELIRDIYTDDVIVSAAAMPPEMITFYTRRCKQEYGPTALYAAEIHRENESQFMCYKMRPRTVPGIKAMCEVLGMRMVKNSLDGWKFSCVPTT